MASAGPEPGCALGRRRRAVRARPRSDRNVAPFLIAAVAALSGGVAPEIASRLERFESSGPASAAYRARHGGRRRMPRSGRKDVDPPARENELVAATGRSRRRGRRLSRKPVQPVRQRRVTDLVRAAEARVHRQPAGPVPAGAGARAPVRRNDRQLHSAVRSLPRGVRGPAAGLADRDGAQAGRMAILAEDRAWLVLTHAKS